MAVSYDRLWKLLIDKKMSKVELRKKADIAPNTLTKLNRDEEVSIRNSRVCQVKCVSSFLHLFPQLSAV